MVLAIALSILVSIWTCQAASNGSSVEPVYMCDSKIYCQGPILEAVNRLEIFDDSKYFVDMPLKKSQVETLQDFATQFSNDQSISVDGLRKFIDDHFYPPGGELTPCELPDWIDEPGTFNLIKDPKYRAWANDLNGIWRELCRKINESVLTDFDRNSLMYVPNNFVAPGGRFREFYYWDTYWIIKGLLVSEMYNTTKGIIQNFGYILDKLGFIPNGGRIYYQQRSQPPFFIPMIYEYYAETQDTNLLLDMLPYMSKELEFWRHNRTVQVEEGGKNYTVYRYYTNSNTPRPESYKEDVRFGSRVTDEAQRAQLYRNIATGAESGIDFSGRFFADRKNLSTIRATEVLPVDLNAILCWAHGIMVTLHTDLGNQEEAKKHTQIRDEFRAMLDAVFYNKSIGSWFDRDYVTGEHLRDFYPSNAVPLFTGCYDPLDATKPRRFYDYMNKTGALSFPSGIPSSLVDTNQQWDLPNGWAPHIHMIIEGFRKSDDQRMQEQAYELATKWLDVNYLVYRKTGHMFEKYNVTDTSYRPGGGGEYDVQTGFGWTNGVVLDLLRTYGARLQAPSDAKILKQLRRL